ncbi:hypothetical protein M076_5208 [Bacteroides fragilis str. 2-F-2 |uniref:Uncharacterized protein n=1 Tax=Bacteroides fragilis str. 2-F-2 \|nr:hypothetical protein M145_4559 [Bacteroides fragilis str. 34-F-2 \
MIKIQTLVINCQDCNQAELHHHHKECDEEANLRKCDFL